MKLILLFSMIFSNLLLLLQKKTVQNEEVHYLSDAKKIGHFVDASNIDRSIDPKAIKTTAKKIDTSSAVILQKNKQPVNKHIAPPSFEALLFNTDRSSLLRPGLTAYRDSIKPPVTLSDTPGVKVIISNGREGLEFSPLSSQNNGALIQPINRITNTGMSTAFYLADNNSWSFYTSAQPRLMINGDGSIISNSSLLINNKEGNDNALQVHGDALFDSTLMIRDSAGSNTFISINTHIRSAATEPDDGISPYTLTPISWAHGAKIPVFRLRHPNTVALGEDGVNTSIRKDFMIFPYQYGTAIEYNGVVECWVGEWSIHRGRQYNDVEGTGNGWGGVLWIGDDGDLGGVRATARNNIDMGGTVQYGELSVEKFAGAANGDFRFRLPSTQNEFHFVYGARGSTSIIAKVTNQGLVIPKAASITGLIAPEKAQLTFDNTDNEFKGYNGTEWKVLSGNDLFTGTTIFSSSGSDIVYAIAHGQTTTPSYFNVIATSADAAGISYITADASHLFVHYTSPPPGGSGNLSWNWQLKK